MKQRITPTHFIEVYKTLFKHYIIDEVKPIEKLDVALYSTESIGFETLFIWKIKFKK